MSNAFKEAQDASKKESLEYRCVELVRKYKRVEAVKLYRSEVGCGLREAMDAVEQMKR